MANTGAVTPYGGRTFIILNPTAGQETAARLRRLLGGAFAARGASFDLVETEGAGHATELARGAAERGYRAVCVVGGDGTLAEAATGLAGTTVPLAIIPRGTANQVAHNKHRHMLVGTVAATMAGAIAMIGRVIQWGAIFGMGGRDRDEGGNPIALLAMAIVAPIAAMVVQFAISRQNEYQADRTGAEICGQPLALAGALRKLDAYARRIPMEVNPAAAQLAIINPLSGGQGLGMLRLFSTHPSTEDRVAKLQDLAADPRYNRLTA
jgi:hypothetical protein